MRISSSMDQAERLGRRSQVISVWTQRSLVVGREKGKEALAQTEPYRTDWQDQGSILLSQINGFEHMAARTLEKQAEQFIEIFKLFTAHHLWVSFDRLDYTGPGGRQARAGRRTG
jgi:hypothetical protein